jgi:hypothetical protein
MKKTPETEIIVADRHPELDDVDEEEDPLMPPGEAPAALFCPCGRRRRLFRRGRLRSLLLVAFAFAFAFAVVVALLAFIFI